jgi:hypothetical protein
MMVPVLVREYQWNANARSVKRNRGSNAWRSHNDMGYQTDFYGRLNFKKKLTKEQLRWIATVIDAGDYKAESDVLEENDVEAAVWEDARRNQIPGCALVFGNSPAVRADARGFIVGEDLSPAYARHMVITPDKKGLAYGAEKGYDMVAGVNFIIANARLMIPDCGLEGSLFALTDFEPFEWLLKIGADGWAIQEPCDANDLWNADRRAFLHWKKSQLRRLCFGPIWSAARRHRDGLDANGFQKAVGALCCGYVKMAWEISRRIWRIRYGAEWPEAKW